MNFLKEFFDENKIEYYGILDYVDVNESSPEIIGREVFTPRSVIIYLLPYYTGETENISRYAASLDYHIEIRKINEKLKEILATVFPEYHSKGYGDHSPIDERDAAIKAGLGILGKNGLLINEKYGSYVFVADVITDIPPEMIGSEPPKPTVYCQGCGKCLSSCPTGILRGECGECLSAITQKKGELSEWEISLMRKHGTVWGCDLCQSSCPYNEEPALTPLEFFYQQRIERLSLEMLDAMDKQTFEKRAFAWRGRKTVRRNLELLKYNKSKL